MSGSEKAMPGSEKAMSGGDDLESFFDQNPAPGDYSRLVELLEDFCLLQATSCRCVVKAPPWSVALECSPGV